MNATGRFGLLRPNEPTLENPVTGETYRFRETSEDRLQFEYVLAPGGFPPGRFDHVHPRQQERFEIESGALGVRIDGDEWTATEGTRFAIPPRTPHTIWNDGDEPMRATIEIRPALDIRTFFETMAGLAREGKTNRWGLPGPLQFAVIADEFRDELYFAAVPRSLQVGVAATLASVGRLAGYQASHPRYDASTASKP